LKGGRSFDLGKRLLVALEKDWQIRIH